MLHTYTQTTISATIVVEVYVQNGDHTGLTFNRYDAQGDEAKRKEGAKGNSGLVVCSEVLTSVGCQTVASSDAQMGFP